jgi:hypothetical protein
LRFPRPERKPCRCATGEGSQIHIRCLPLVHRHDAVAYPRLVPPLPASNDIHDHGTTSALVRLAVPVSPLLSLCTVLLIQLSKPTSRLIPTRPAGEDVGQALLENNVCQRSLASQLHEMFEEGLPIGTLRNARDGSVELLSVFAPSRYANGPLLQEGCVRSTR